MIRILVICTSGHGAGNGVTRHIMNYMALIAKNPDFKIFIGKNNADYQPNIDKFKEMGCQIADFPERFSRPLAYMRAIYRFIKNNKIDMIHVHGSSGTMCMEFLPALLGGTKERIAQSHNTGNKYPIIDRLLRPLFHKLVTKRLACGEDAGKYMYGKRPFTIIHNGINCNEFQYNDNNRTVIRKELHIDNNKVLGHIGLLRPEKNHKFLLIVFKELISIDPTWKLMLFGKGDLESEIKEQVESLELTDKVLFMGIKDNVGDYLSAMDIFVFPSLHEGLPFVVLEAQANGLRCILSDTITKQVNLTGNVDFLPLDVSADEWAGYILEKYDDDLSRRLKSSKKAIDDIIGKHYDMNHKAQILSKIYNF